MTALTFTPTQPDRHWIAQQPDGEWVGDVSRYRDLPLYAATLRDTRDNPVLLGYFKTAAAAKHRVLWAFAQHWDRVRRFSK